MSENCSWVRMAVWGDSIVHGACDEQAGGWINRLRTYVVSRKRGDHVFNLGLGGDTSYDVLDRIQPELVARLGHIDHVFISVGVNEITNSQKLTPPEAFSANLKEIIRLVRKYQKQPHLISMTPIGCVQEQWKLYNQIIEKVASEMGVGFFDVSTTLSLPEDAVDGIHPTAAGHEKIYRKMKELLFKANILPAE